MMRNSWLLSFYAVVFISCFSKKQLADEGVVIVNDIIFDSAGNEDSLLSVRFRIWFKGNSVVEEVLQTNLSIDTNSNVSINRYVKHYLFIDRDTKLYYLYKNFSDTAGFLDSYANADSVFIQGGWNFYTKGSIDFVGIPENLTDTLIDGIVYRRKKFMRKANSFDFVSEGYYRCDMTNSIFGIFQNEFNSCSMVKLFDYQGSKIRAKTEIIFLRNKLKKDENRIFSAWKQNAKKYRKKNNYLK